jgi:acylglycerol lipase
MLKNVSKDIPLFLYGHSLGGLLVLTLAMKNPTLNFAGIISTSALLGFPRDRRMNFFKKWILKNLGKKLEDIVINCMYLFFL